MLLRVGPRLRELGRQTTGPGFDYIIVDERLCVDELTECDISARI